ncbi:hypothetical protein OG552_00420 [Streptomyces sp. NBC_01476]|uniref:hypothetical protein n=1 Tax=Streptomyces sp. NBC_01476 TaxID=2903881 RepID=UPI002E30180E|nr:hypothetical protein [Streptomyces sp. NBC_01476]
MTLFFRFILANLALSDADTWTPKEAAMNKVLALQSLDPTESEETGLLPITTSNSHLSVILDCTTTITRATE